MKQHYWILECPDYANDHQSIRVNGLADHKFVLPGVKCRVCKNTWVGLRILPYHCPQQFQTEDLLTRAQCVPWNEKFFPLKRNLEQVLAEAGVKIDLQPGDSFQPVVLEFASQPIQDFLWPTVGSAIVQPRVRELFESHNISGVEFFEAEVKKVGKLKPTDPTPDVPEPEDVVFEAKPDKRLVEFAPLFQMVVTSTSGFPLGVKLIRKCETCGYEKLKAGRGEDVLTESIIPNTDVFLLGSTGGVIIVSQKVADLIRQNRLTNVELKEIEVR